MVETYSPVLVEVTRGAEVESRHRGEIAVVDEAGAARRHLGDPEVRVCMRSLAKPFQALPLLTTGAAEAFGFGPEELALMSGSLSGQDFQVALVEQILTRMGLQAGALQCGSHAPLHRPTAKALAQAGAKPTPLHHTCAGKHASMLALCVHHGWPLEDYLNPAHPVQQLILNTVAEMVGLNPADIIVAL
jgi:L-asparaginase II